MKKLMLLAVIIMGFSAASFAQSTAKSTYHQPKTSSTTSTQKVESKSAQGSTTHSMNSTTQHAAKPSGQQQEVKTKTKTTTSTASTNKPKHKHSHHNNMNEKHKTEKHTTSSSGKK